MNIIHNELIYEVYKKRQAFVCTGICIEYIQILIIMKRANAPCFSDTRI